MVSISPRMRDSLDYEEPDAIDPRMSLGFRSVSLDASGYEEHDPVYDHRPFTASPDPTSSRRRRRQRQSDRSLTHAQPFIYQALTDRRSFRLAVLKPGVGTQPIEIDLIQESSVAPRRDYKCLSYCWLTTVQDAAILVDGCRFRVTSNLLSALRNVRKRREKALIWVDQICINQNDFVERGHQVSIMKFIYNRARQVVVWLGEFDRSDKLCEYAKKMKRNDSESARSTLKRILPSRQLQDAIQKLLDQPWFGRVWVISEVCLASTIRVSCGGGDAIMSWENLISLARDRATQQTSGFAKQEALLGNPKQRIAIITDMMSQQKAGISHADISQLLILAKSSNATHDHDKIYAFYGLTLLTTTPDYARSVESLYVEVARDYINAIEACYAAWKDPTDATRTFQLMSILYSAGALHQHYALPSWVPDWTYTWHLAPIWAKTAPTLLSAPSRDAWTESVRSAYRAGGERRENFEIIAATDSGPRLRLSAVILDTIATTDTSALDPDPGLSNERLTSTSSTTSSSPIEQKQPPLSAAPFHPTPTATYGRASFRTQKEGFAGLATPGVQPGDVLAILLGGDVPVVLRPLPPPWNSAQRPFRLLCECFVLSREVMCGEVVESGAGVEDVVLV